MCGRYSIFTEVKKLEKRFNAFFKDDFSARYYATPSQNLPVLPNTHEREIQLFRWGLIPCWAKDASPGNKMINARAETITEKPSFKSALRKQRCLVLADGFYEWKQTPNSKIPMLITLKTGKPFAFAGLWDTWKNENGETIRTFTIITTEANGLVSEIHTRMPVILPPEKENFWLDNSLKETDFLELLKPLPSEEMLSVACKPKENSDKILLFKDLF